MIKPTIAEMRKAVADDLYDAATNNRNFRSNLVDEYVKTMSDDDIVQAYADAGLGCNDDEDD